MRVFQNIHLYPQQLEIVNKKVGSGASFDQRMQAIKRHGLNGPHILHPVYENGSDSFFTTTADVVGQRQWALENGFPGTLHPYDVLVEQLKTFKPDLFYTHGAFYFPESVLQQLSSLCKINICWKAPPDFSPQVTGFNMLVNNFASSLPKYAELTKIKTGYLSPSSDPAMEPMCFNETREIDIVFAGAYTRHHRRRAEIIEALSGLAEKFRVKFFLLQDKATRIGNSPLGLLPGLSKYRVPRGVRKISSEPVFGDEMYRHFSNAKIVVNSAIDIAGEDRGNIRCFEVMGCGALLVSDEGIYPPGMEHDINMLTYSSTDHLMKTLEAILADEPKRQKLARAGLALAQGRYSKKAVWENLKQLASTVK